MSVGVLITRDLVFRSVCVDQTFQTGYIPDTLKTADLGVAGRLASSSTRFHVVSHRLCGDSPWGLYAMRKATIIVEPI